jgi:hypothetical protein
VSNCNKLFSTAAHQHGVIAVFIGGGGDATDRAQHAADYSRFCLPEVMQLIQAAQITQEQHNMDL